MKQIIKSFRLNSKGIDDISAEIQAGMKENGVQRENIIRSRLALESLLLDLANHYGDDQEVSITYGSRLGNRFFDISYEVILCSDSPKHFAVHNGVFCDLLGFLA